MTDDIAECRHRFPTGLHVWIDYTETRTFFVYDVESDNVTLKGEVSTDRRFSALLEADLDGNVFGAGSCGSLFTYHPASDTLADLGKPIPSIQDR